MAMALIAKKYGVRVIMNTVQAAFFSIVCFCRPKGGEIVQEERPHNGHVHNNVAYAPLQNAEVPATDSDSDMFAEESDVDLDFIYE
jgi:hypothetical protein